MYKSILTFALAILALPCALSAGYLVKDGKTSARIYMPKEFGRPVMLAANELSTYVKKMTGAELPIDYGNPVPWGAKVLLQVDKSRGRIEDGSDQGFAIEEDGNVLTIRGNSDLGLLYGVYQYLDELGVRWFTPGEIGENVPQLKDIAIGKRSKEYLPSFRSRVLDMSGVWSQHFDNRDKDQADADHIDYDLWLMRNRLQFNRTIHFRHHFDFDWARESSGHNVIKMALRNADFEKEPERFALVTRDDGQKRRDKGPRQICFTDERNVQTAIDSAVAYFTDLSREHTSDIASPHVIGMEPVTIPMGLADCSGICECANCKKAEGNPPYEKDRLVLGFMNKVARGLNERLPGKKIALFYPYFELHRPPADVKMEPNILAVTCRGIGWSIEEADKPFYPFTKAYAGDVEATRKAGAETGSYDYILFAGTPQPLNVLDAVKIYKSAGNKYYTSEVMGRDEQRWPIVWSLAQYTWNSNEDPWSLFKRFCTEYYGPAGEKVYAVQKLIDESSKTLPRIIYGGTSDAQWIMSEEVIRKGSAILGEAEKNVTGREKVRLALFRDTFDMLSAEARTIRAYSHALNERTPEATAAAFKSMDDFESLWQKRDLSRTCSPSILEGVKAMRKAGVPEKAEPKGRKELADRSVWMKELFAFDKVPASVPNLFSLPEVWKFRLDPEDAGAKSGWQKSDYNDSRGWQPISTYDWFESQGYPEIDGRFWYRVNFTAPRFPAGKKIYLRIGSLDDEGDIYVNGELAYRRKHVNANDWQSSFAVDITKYIKAGAKNVIAVCGYDATGAGGIWRPCALYTD